MQEASATLTTGARADGRVSGPEGMGFLLRSAASPGPDRDPDWPTDGREPRIRTSPSLTCSRLPSVQIAVAVNVAV